MTSPFAKSIHRPRSSASLAALSLRWRAIEDEIAALQETLETTDQPGWKAALAEDIDSLTHEQYGIVAAAAAVRAPHPEGIAAKLALLEAFTQSQCEDFPAIAGTPLDLFASLQRDLAVLSRTMS